MVEVPAEVRLVIGENRWFLEKLFGEYAVEPHKPIAKQRLPEDRYLQFARDVRLCPGLLPRVEALQLFRAMESVAEEARPEWNGIRRRRNAGFLRYADFCACLAATAAVVFAGDEWRQPQTFAHKFQLLLLWLRQQKQATKQRPVVLEPSTHDERQRAVGAVGRRAVGRRAVVRTAASPVPTTSIRTPSVTPAPSAAGAGKKEVSRRTPQVSEELLAGLRRVFLHFCARGDRLNVGPSAALSRLQCVRLLEHCGCMVSPRLRERVDVALAARKDRRLDFDGLVALLASIAPDVLAVERRAGALQELLESRKATLSFQDDDRAGRSDDDGALLLHHLLRKEEEENGDEQTTTTNEKRPEKQQQQQGENNIKKKTKPSRAAEQQPESFVTPLPGKALKEGLSSPRDDVQRDDAWPTPRLRFPAEHDDLLGDVAAETPPSCQSAMRAEARRLRAAASLRKRSPLRDDANAFFPAAESSTPSTVRTTSTARADDASGETKLVRLATSPLESLATPEKNRDAIAPSLASLVDAISRQLSATSVAGVPLVDAKKRQRRGDEPVGYEDLGRDDDSDPSRARASPIKKRASSPARHLVVVDAIKARDDNDRDLYRRVQAQRERTLFFDDRVRRAAAAAKDDVDPKKMTPTKPDDDDAAARSQRDRDAELRDLEAALVEQSRRLEALQERLTSSASSSSQAQSSGAAGTATTTPQDRAEPSCEPGDQDRIFAVVPVPEAVDRSKWRNVAAKRTSSRRGWVIADPDKAAAAHRDRSAEFWSGQVLECERAIGATASSPPVASSSSARRSPLRQRGDASSSARPSSSPS